MHSDKGKIAHHFASKLRNHEEVETPDVWNGISIGVKKKLFYQFRWDYFNIYYLSISSVILIAIVSLFIYTKYSTLIKEKNSQNSLIENPIPKDTVLLNTIVKEAKTKNNSQTTTNSNKEVAPIINSIQTNIIGETLNEKLVTDDTQPIKEIKKIETTKPIVIVRKRDTIIDVDTINVYKRKKRK